MNRILSAVTKILVIFSLISFYSFKVHAEEIEIILQKLQEDINIVLRFLVACALLHLLLLGLNTFISGLLGLKWPERTAMILSGSQKTLPNGMDVWKKSFAENEYGAVPLVLYHLFQLLVDTLLVPKFEKRNPSSKDGDLESFTINCHGDEKD